jgi:hypothetical protein
MNVYDFDGTIFASDCSIGFCFWCMNRHPKLWFTFFPKALRNLILKKKGKMPEYLMQRKFFGYLTLIDDFDEQIERYWDKNEKKIAPWYLAQKRPDDLIISASPTCIIEPIAKRLGVISWLRNMTVNPGFFSTTLCTQGKRPGTSLTRAFRGSNISTPIPWRIRRLPCWLKRRTWSPIKPVP